MRLSPAILLLLAACSGSSEPQEGTSPTKTASGTVATSSEHLTFAIPRGGVESTASIHTLPNAACSLRDAAKAPGAGKQMPVIADDDGIARLRLRQSDPAGDHVVLALDCTDDAGRITTQTLDVTVADDAVPQLPEAVSKVGKPRLSRLDVEPDVAEPRGGSSPRLPSATGSERRAGAIRGNGSSSSRASRR